MNEAPPAKPAASVKHFAGRYAKSRGQALKSLDASHKEELDHREGIWRAVPAMIAGFAFYIAALGYTLRHVDLLNSNSTYWQLMFSLTLCSITFAVAAFILVLMVLQYRTYQALPYQDETISYFDKLVDRIEWDRRSGRICDTECDEIALARMQMALIDDLAQTVTANRKIDEPRYLQRGKAFTYLCYSYAFLVSPILSLTVSGLKPS